MSLLPARAWLAIAAAALVLIALWWLRLDAAQDARNEADAKAAINQEGKRRGAEAAARDAQRDDVRERLHRGTFLLDPVPPRD